MIRPGILVTGAAGIIGTLLLDYLEDRYTVTALDIVGASRHQAVIWRRGSVADERLIRQLIEGQRFVIHLATGQRGGWQALRDAEIEGTRLLLDTARDLGVERVVLASSNHVVGGYERDVLSGSRRSDPLLANEPIRPDSSYGAAKAFVEAYGRYIAETSELRVSCLRIGTVRPIDDPDHYLRDPDFEAVPGGASGIRVRLSQTWLHHGDLLRAVDEELAAKDRFRLRFLSSSSALWSQGITSWPDDAKERH